jgi:membrane protein required for colicin V production
VILVLLIAKGVEKLVSIVGMGILNRINGGVFGLLKGIIFVSVLIFIFCKFDSKGKIMNRETREKSMIFGYIEPVFPFIIRVSGAEIKFPSVIMPEGKK